MCPDQEIEAKNAKKSANIGRSAIAPVSPKHIERHPLHITRLMEVPRLYAALGKPDDDPSYFLFRPADQIRTILVLSLLLGVAVLARCRMTAIIENASMTSDT